MIVKHGLVPDADPLDSLDSWDFEDDELTADELFELIVLEEGP